MEPYVGLQGLYKIYKGGDIETVALRGAELSIGAGEFVAITGRSGAGKSTLLNIMGGLATPSAGRVVIGGTDIARMSETERARFRRERIGIVYQADNLIPFLSALENVMLPMQTAGRRDAADVVDEVAQQLAAIGGMNHLGVEHGGVVAPGLVHRDGEGGILRRSDNGKALG